MTPVNRLHICFVLIILLHIDAYRCLYANVSQIFKLQTQAEGINPFLACLEITLKTLWTRA